MGLGVQGYIVVETNFRIYAYTTSQLQTRILQLFLRSAENVTPGTGLGIPGPYWL